MKTISVVVPIHNEAEGIKNFLDHHLLPAIGTLDRYRSELLLINDGSTDKTLEILQEYVNGKNHRKNQKRKTTNMTPNNLQVRLISFSRNFGKEAALSAGLQYATGDAVITIDADGQQPPKLIPKFIEKWEAGATIVTGLRDHFTQHGLIQKIGSKLFYWLLRKMGNHYTAQGSTDYRLLDRTVVDEFNKLSERSRITRGLIDWLGFEQTYVKYTYGTRMAGKPSYSLKKLFRLAIDSFVSMSITPLVFLAYLGAAITLLSGALGLFCIINQYILGDPLHLYWNGAVQMTIFITFLIGIVLISQAITALYISHIHTETQARPLYVINKKSSKNLEDK